MIDLIAPQGVVVYALSGFLNYPMFPEETRSLGDVVDKRRTEFATGRHCARQAMQLLGTEPCAIPIGSGREPLWPVGLTGSITHCSGYCAAALANANDFATIGIDAEENSPLPEGVLSVIATPDEKRKIQEIPSSYIHWDRLLFSAKESVYKAWYAITYQWLDFQECDVTFESLENQSLLSLGLFGGRFTAQLSRCYSLLDTSQSQFHGQYVCNKNHLVTLITVHKRAF